ncbi:MAG: succinylglutamate desuccinylase/aspartoacylase family protein [Nitriliruptorales bacterium]|nr:succinylglutamate desuccinylase/aspartoacylase family protein [Nitriliruptorales bacterium]
MSNEAFNWFPDGLPADLLGLEPLDLLHQLQRPTLIRVPGSGHQAPRAVATLLHGDESTGLLALQKILERQRTYRFDFYVVIGNVRAALADEGFQHRYLDDQEDFNRIWGIDDPTTHLRLAADGILAKLREAEIESLIDIHNNSGNNPFYAIVTRDRPVVVNTATFFTTTLLFWDMEAHTLMEALEDECAAIAVECGLPGRPESLAFAVDALRRYLGAGPMKTDVARRDYDLLGNIRKVVIRPEVAFRFGGNLADDVDFVIDGEADVHNFVQVSPGHVLGHVVPGAAMPLQVIDHRGADVTGEHFDVDDGRIVITTSATPVMMTRTEEAARKDCLFYLADELPPPRL